MKRAAAALFVSLAAHALLAVAIAFGMRLAPEPDLLVELDLSSVELSVAEEEDDSAAVVRMPSAASPSEQTRPPTPQTPPEVAVAERPPLPYDPGELKFPEPKERRPEIKEDARPRQTASEAAQVAAPAPRQAKVEAPPRPKRTIRPDYPRGARQRGEQGDVVVEMTVGESGTVNGAKVVLSSGFAELDEAAVKAVKAAKFTPARSGDRAVSAVARLRLTFRLR